MRKLLLSLLLTVACLSGWAQTLVGGQLPIKVRTASYGATQNALLSLPDDYNTTTAKYPLIIFLHGYGEVGNSVADLSKLIKQGLPQVISSGTKIQATNPVDGKPYKFIVVSPQHWGWTTEPASIEYMLGELAKTYRVDTNRIYITGLSAGGQGVVQACTYSQSLTNKIAAIVPMSPSAPDNNFMSRFRFFAQAKTAAWFFSGNNDKTGPFTDNARRYNDSINKYNTNASRMTVYPGSHCCWPTYYTPTYREGGMNIYEWMLTHTRGIDTVPPMPPVPDREICIGQAKSIRKVIVLMKDGSYREYDSTSFVIPKIQVELR
jgi:predicted peptidase